MPGQIDDEDFVPSLADLFEMGFDMPPGVQIGGGDPDIIQPMGVYMGGGMRAPRSLPTTMAAGVRRVPAAAAAAQGGGSPLADLMSSAASKFDLVSDDPRKITALDAKGRRKDPEWYHPVGGGVKLKTPYSELTSTTVPTGGAALPPQRQFNPEDLVGGVGLALLGDKTRAGETLTHVGGLELPRTQELHGGYRFMDEFPGSVWAADQGSMKRIMDRATEEAQRTGKPVYGLPVSMGAESNDSARMMTGPALSMTNLPDIPPAVLEAFDNKMRTLTTDKKGVTRWPGLAAAKADDNWLQTASGGDRATLIKTMSEGGFADWFPNMAALRKATTAPDLVNRPALTTGMSVGRFDMDRGAISDPARAHNTYNTQNAGESLGRIGLLPYDAVFQRFAQSRPAGEQVPQTMRTMMTQVPAQEFDQQWLDNFMRRVEGARD